MQRIVHRDERVDIDGNGFSAIGRLALQEILQKLCRDAGVKIEYGRGVRALDSSRTRTSWSAPTDRIRSCERRCKRGFSPKIELLTNRFAWYGTTQPSIASRSPFAATSTVHLSLTITATLRR